VQRVLGLQARNKNIEIINNIPSVLVLSIDKDMITTVFRNLISNAIKFTPNDGKIFLNATHNHQIVEIVIKDTGIGMSNESISKLFQIKHKQNQLGTNNEKGTGLGLIICKEFIEKHNGEIEVESTLGEGTSFTIKLPKL
jgi:signal transduction histidine kinase